MEMLADTEANVRAGAANALGRMRYWQAGSLLAEGLRDQRWRVRREAGIALRGLDIVVKGSVGHMSAFMAQAGNLVVLGDTGDALGDSLYEARLFVRGAVKSLGSDCVQKEMRDEHKADLRKLLDDAGVSGIDVAEFTRYGSARNLYHFHIDNAGQY